MTCSDLIPAGALVRQGVLEARLLTSVHVLRERAFLLDSPLGRTRLAPGNPFLGDEQQARLDRRGILRKGSVTREGDVLISLVTVVRGERPARAGFERVRDASSYVLPDQAGFVVRSARRLRRRDLAPQERAPGLRAQVVVTLRAERDLEVGDLLLVEREPLAPVAGFRPDCEMRLAPDGRAADVVVSPAAGARLGLSPGEHRTLAVGKGPRAAERVRARTEGPYSLITLQPLGRSSYAGQPIRPEHVRWLCSRGLQANLAELVATKSDDLWNRPRLRQASAAVPFEAPAGAPETLLTLVAWLRGLGLDVAFQTHGDHVDLTLRPATREQILAQSSGRVRRAETIHYRTYREVEGGLFCPAIFGPSEGACRRRFGHIQLPAPIVPLIWRTGSPSALERLLRLPGREIERVVRCEARVAHSADGAVAVRAIEPGEPGEPADLEDLGTGGAAIRELLRRIPEVNLPPGLRCRPDAICLDVLPVLPHDLRPLVLMDSGNFASSDLNDHSIRLINRANRLAKLEELNAPAAILWSERRMLQLAADALLANSLVPHRYAVWIGKPKRRLRSLLDFLIESDRARCKQVEFSGSAVTLPDPALPDSTARIAARVFDTLGLAPGLPVLLTRPAGDGTFVAAWPERHDRSVLSISPATAARLGLFPEEAALCSVHVPLSEAARSEARRLVERDQGPLHEVPASALWLEESDPKSYVLGLVDAALRYEPVHLDSPGSLLVGGTGAIGPISDPPPGNGLPREPETREVPLSTPRRPPAPACPPRPVRGLLEIVAEHRRKAVVLRPRRTSAEPPAERGRVGGRPWLPHGFRWPCSGSGRPHAFIAQLPLDPAREAGAVSLAAKPGSLLTLFWDGELEPAETAYVFAFGDLAPADAPRGTELGPLCAIEPEVVEEAPTWDAAVELLKAELGRLDPAALLAFRQLAWKTLPQARDAIKIGGWPCWIQSPATEGVFVGQVPSDETTRLSFGDRGTLFAVERAGRPAIYPQSR